MEATMTSEEKQTVYLIPEDNFARFQSKIEKLSRKSLKIIGAAINPVVIGEEYKKFDVQGLPVTIKFLKVFLDAPVAKIEGWTFVATVDHTNEVGNIIRAVPNTNIPVPTKYRECAPNCEHCRINRQRNETFVLFADATKEYKQVGRNCLADFFGRDPAAVARLAELLTLAAETADSESEYDGMGGGSSQYVDLVTYLTFVAESIRRYGWVSRRAVMESGDDTKLATASDAEITMRNVFNGKNKDTTTEEDKQTATEALEWVQNLSEADRENDFLYNIWVVGKSGYTKWKTMGLAAAVVFAFLKEKARLAERAKQKSSEWIGAEGDKVEFTGTISKIIPIDSMYGTNFMYMMKDEVGNVIKYVSSKKLTVQDGDTVKVSSKIKKLDEYKSVKQTVIGGRCKTTVEKVEG